METTAVCPECGTSWRDGVTCQDHFHQMLYWESEDPARFGEVHHLMVLVYHLQHPSLYSPETLRGGMSMLESFLNGTTPQQMRQQMRDKVDSGKRTWKVTGTPESHGAYEHPVQWTMTAADVIAAGRDNYCDSVRAWARAAYESLKAAGNMGVMSNE